MTFFYVLFFIASFTFSFLINTLFLKFSKTLGIRDKNETVIRWASTSKPALGGISFFLVFLISLASYSIFFQTKEVLWNTRVVGLLGTTTIAFMMGLADDAYNTKPFLKFFVQIICGAILCYSGIHIGIFPSMALNYILTIFWVVGIMNSINMLDNMDAIATVVSISIFSNAIMLIYLSGAGSNNIHFLILIGLVASLFGFLVFNWHPSKLYMGDTGSQILGLLLAAIGIIYFWNDSSSLRNSISISKQLVIVAIGFALPLADTTIVFINRVLQKKSPFVGGRDHTTHNLFFRGITEKRIALIFAAIGVVGIILIFIIEKRINEWDTTHFAIFSLFPITIFITLFSLTKIKKNTRNRETTSGTDIEYPANLPIKNVEENLT